MAKKTKTESVLSRETRMQAEADAMAGDRAIAEARATEEQSAEAAKKRRVVTPAPAKAMRPKKAKKARFVRERTEKKPETKATPLPERSTKPGGKMMTKNLSYRPKDESRTGR